MAATLDAMRQPGRAAGHNRGTRRTGDLRPVLRGAGGASGRGRCHRAGGSVDHPRGDGWAGHPRRRGGPARSCRGRFDRGRPDLHRGVRAPLLPPARRRHRPLRRPRRAGTQSERHERRGTARGDRGELGGASSSGSRVPARRPGVRPEDVTVIAVTKTFPATDVGHLAALGLHDVGENRADEADDKEAHCRAAGVVGPALALRRPAADQQGRRGRPVVPTSCTRWTGHGSWTRSTERLSGPGGGCDVWCRSTSRSGQVPAAAEPRPRTWPRSRPPSTRPGHLDLAG